MQTSTDMPIEGNGLLKPMIILVGKPRSGKSYLGKILAQELRLPFVSVGDLIEKKLKTIHTDRIIPRELIVQCLENLKESPGVVLDTHIVTKLGSLEEDLSFILDRTGYYLACIVEVTCSDKICFYRHTKCVKKRSTRAFWDMVSTYKKKVPSVLKRFSTMGKVIQASGERGARQEAQRICSFLEKSTVINQLYRFKKLLKTEKHFVTKLKWKKQDLWSLYFPLVSWVSKIFEQDSVSRIVIAITGPTSVGKSYFSKHFCTILNYVFGNKAAAVLSQDRFFIGSGSQPIDVDVDGIEREITRFKKKGEILQPIVELCRGKRKKVAMEINSANRILLVEGGYLLLKEGNFTKLAKSYNIKLYLDAKVEDIEKWWIERECVQRKIATTKANKCWDEEISSYVRENQATQFNSDIVIKMNSKHQPEEMLTSTLLGRGICLSASSTVHTTNADPKIIDKIIKLITKTLNSKPGLSSSESSIAYQVLSAIKDLETIKSIHVFSPLVKNDRDFLCAFVDHNHCTIAIAYEILYGDMEDIMSTLFYLTFLLSYGQWSLLYHRNVYKTIAKKLFGYTKPICRNKIKKIIQPYTYPQKVTVTKISSERIKKINDLQTNKILPEIKKIARGFNASKAIMFISPTAEAGGFVTIRKGMSSILASPTIGISSTWISMVRHSNPEFNGLTSAIESILRGRKSGFTHDEACRYKNAMILNLRGLGDLSSFSYFVLDDIYPLGLIPELRKVRPDAKIAWIYHTSTLSDNNSSTNFLNRYLDKADVALFWPDAYIPKKIKIQAVKAIFGGVDPFNFANMDLPEEFLISVLEKYGINPDRPMLFQAGRYNQTKNQLTSVISFKLSKERNDRMKEFQYVAMGVPMSVGDTAIANKLEEFSNALGEQRNIHILTPDIRGLKLSKVQEQILRKVGVNTKSISETDINAMEINALQRRAFLNMHPVTDEAFGLTITEAIIKKRPILATKVGGIAQQINNSEFLINEPSKKSRVLLNQAYQLLLESRYCNVWGKLSTDAFIKSFSNGIIDVVSMKKVKAYNIVNNNYKKVISNFLLLNSVLVHLKTLLLP